jgi:hypothetical protein
MRLNFTIREWCFLTVTIAVCLGWYVDHLHLKDKAEEGERWRGKFKVASAYFEGLGWKIISQDQGKKGYRITLEPLDSPKN